MNDEKKQQEKQNRGQKDSDLKCPVCGKLMSTVNDILDQEGKHIWLCCVTKSGYKGTLDYPSVEGACPLEGMCFKRLQIITGEWVKHLLLRNAPLAK